MFVVENIIRELARIVKRPDHEIAELNLFTEGSITHYNQTLVNCNVKRYPPLKLHLKNENPYGFCSFNFMFYDLLLLTKLI